MRIFVFLSGNIYLKMKNNNLFTPSMKSVESCYCSLHACEYYILGLHIGDFKFKLKYRT